jgi:uncharacterized membrane protein YphA (DoxX/SURF4 family)
MEAQWLPDVVAGFGGSVLIYAGCAKAGELRSFARSLQWLAPSTRAQSALAWTLVVLEVALGVGLMVPLLHSWAATFATGLLLVFTVVLGYARVRGLEATCMCFGNEAEPIDASVLLRDLGLAALYALLIPVALSGSLYLTLVGVGVYLLALVVGTMRMAVRAIWEVR